MDSHFWHRAIVADGRVAENLNFLNLSDWFKANHLSGSEVIGVLVGERYKAAIMGPLSWKEAAKHPAAMPRAARISSEYIPASWSLLTHQQDATVSEVRNNGQPSLVIATAMACPGTTTYALARSKRAQTAAPV